MKKRSLSLLLCVCLILSCTVAALAADDEATISITVRVFDVISGKAYEVGSDTVANGGAAGLVGSDSALAERNRDGMISYLDAIYIMDVLAGTITEESE